MRFVFAILSFLIFSVIASAQTQPATRPTLWLVGDSTVRNGSGNGGNGMWGWGDRVGKSFDAARINVVNRARGGRSSRTFVTEGLWDAILAEAKPGDFAIIQLGHNDGGPLAGDHRERGSIRGVGDESEEVTLTLKAKQGQKETVHTYGWYLRKYIADARQRGITPILCSPIPRRPKDAVDPTTQPTSYALWAQQVAETEHVLFIDLNRIILSHYQGMKPDEIKEKYFTPADDTHTSADGADLNAAAVIEGLKALPTNPLQSFIAAADVLEGYERELPEGNYDVTLTLGSEERETVTTVWAEQRRLMLERVRTAPGKIEKRTFTVNVRRPGPIHLKPREKNYLNWDDKLTLDFAGDKPRVRDVQVTRNDSAVTVYL